MDACRISTLPCASAETCPAVALPYTLLCLAEAGGQCALCESRAKHRLRTDQIARELHGVSLCESYC